MTLSKLDTPCIGICSTVYGDDVCRGCKRFYHEIIGWNGFNNEQKDIIFTRLEQFIVKACFEKLTVTNAEILRKQLEKCTIRYREQQNALCWAYYLLRDEHDNIDDIEKYGVKLNQQYRNIDLKTIYETIDSEVLSLAEASFATTMD